VYAVITTYVRPLEVVDRHRAAHLQWVKEQYAAGRLLVSGRRTPPGGGVLIVRCSSRAELDAVLAEDPFVEAGVIEHAVYEFAPTRAPIAAPEFEAFLDRTAA
jgi:uncharacterized protein YciI